MGRRSDGSERAYLTAGVYEGGMGPEHLAVKTMVRWRIALLVFVAIAISYLDRQTLPVAIESIKKLSDFKISDQQFAWLNTAFLGAYGFMYRGGGWLMDRLGTRRGFALIMLFWSLACASHG